MRSCLETASARAVEMGPAGTSTISGVNRKKTKQNNQTNLPPHAFPKAAMKVLLSSFSTGWKWITAVDQQEIKHFVRKQWGQTKQTQLMKHKVRLRSASLWLGLLSWNRSERGTMRVSAAEHILPCSTREASKKAWQFAEVGIKERTSTKPCNQCLSQSSPRYSGCGGGESLARTARAGHLWGASIQPLLEHNNCSFRRTSSKPGTIPDDTLGALKTRRCQPKSQAAREAQLRGSWNTLLRGRWFAKRPIRTQRESCHRGGGPSSRKSDKCLIITIIFFKWACSLWVTLLKPAQPW